MAGTGRIEEFISPAALAQFDVLEAKVTSSVQEFDLLIGKAVELNKALGNSKGFKEITDNAKALEVSEAALTEQQKKMQAEMERLDKKYQEQAKRLQELTERERKRVEAQNASSSASDEAAAAAERTNKSLGNQEKAYEALIRQSVQNTQASKSLKAEQKALTDQYNKGLVTFDEYQAGLEGIKKTELQLKNANGELNKALSALTRENQSAAGSIQQMDAKLKIMLQSYDRASEEFKASPLGEILLKDINDLTAAISKEEQATGRFQRQVGNYSSATKILEKALQQVNTRLDQYSAEGKQADGVVESLRKESELLNTLLKSQVTGFATATAEMRANTQALQQMEQAGLKGTEAYRQLFQTTAELKDETADLKSALTNAAPDDVAFNAAADAARGLVGVYGLAKSVTAAFGIENEALEETMVKLQAAETALQSIEAIRAVFKKENAVRQAINIGLQKVEILQTNLQAKAESRNIIVKYAAVAAQKALNLVMMANPILLVVGALALATAAFIAFTSATEKAVLNFDQLNAEFEKQKNDLDDYVDSVKRDGDELVASLEAQFADEATIRKQRTQNLREQLKATMEIERERRDDALKTEEFLTAIAKRGGTIDDEQAKEIDKAEKFLADFRDLSRRRVELASQIRISIVGNEKATTEEVVKARQDQLEIQKLQLQQEATVQAALVTNTKKSYAERIAAVREFSRLQQEIANADAAKAKVQPGQTPTQIQLIEKQRSVAVINARKDATKQIEDLQNEALERERKARFEITKLQLEESIKANNLIIANERTGYDKRLTALYEAFSARRAILGAEYAETVRTANLTGEERIALEEKFAADTNQLLTEYGAQQADIYQGNQERFTAIVEREQQKRLDKLTTGQNKEVVALNQAFSDGNVGVEQYARERAEIERRYRLKSLQEEYNVAFAKVIITKEGTAARAAAERELSDITKAISDENLQYAMDNAEKMKQLLGSIRDEAVGFVKDLINGTFEARKNAIQEEIDALEEKKQKDIEVAAASITNEQDRAAAITTINARAQAQKEALERRNRQIQTEQARFNRVASIAEIIANTAVAIIKQISVTPLPAGAGFVAAIAALGALQTARVLAQPIPKYDTGTLDHPGGLAKVHANEMVITPDGRLSYTGGRAEQVMNLPKHTVVVPKAREVIERSLAKQEAIRLLSTDGGKYQREMTDKLGRKLDAVKKAIGSQRQTTWKASREGIYGMEKFGADWWRYIDREIDF